jgi:hypothetical protein
MGHVFLFALLAALNPTLVAASTLMMLLPNPKRLMLGYLCGALMTSITLGIVIVFWFEGSEAVGTTEHSISPAATMTLGGIALAAAFALRPGHESKRSQRRRSHKQDKGPPRWQHALQRGTARTTFVVGALLTLPGGAYLAGLSQIDKLNYSTAETVLLIVAFNLLMLALLEIPLISFTVAPHWTVGAIDRAKASIGRHGRRFASTALGAIGLLLVIKGVIELAV